MLNIDIKTVPHNKQRYPTVGDYYREKHKMHFRISEMQNKDYEFLVAIHELVEQYLCEKEKISIESIDQFDISFERFRNAGDTSEPGDDKKAPYYRQHQIATAIERLMAVHIGVDWNDYDRKIAAL